MYSLQSRPNNRQTLYNNVQWGNSHDLGLSLDSWYCIEEMMMICYLFKHDKRKCQWVRVMQNLYKKNLDFRCATMAAYIFKLQVTNFSFDRLTFCSSLSSVEIHFQSNRYFTTFIVFSTPMLFIYLCTTFIKRIIHNLICSDALCMRNNLQIHAI